MIDELDPQWDYAMCVDTIGTAEIRNYMNLAHTKTLTHAQSRVYTYR